MLFQMKASVNQRYFQNKITIHIFLKCLKHFMSSILLLYSFFTQSQEHVPSLVLSISSLSIVFICAKVGAPSVFKFDHRLYAISCNFFLTNNKTRVFRLRKGLGPRVLVSGTVFLLIQSGRVLFKSLGTVFSVTVNEVFKLEIFWWRDYWPKISLKKTLFLTNGSKIGSCELAFFLFVKVLFE